MEQLDQTDLQILRTLQDNAKLTTKELAEAVHLTPTPGWSARVLSAAMWPCSMPNGWDKA